jgi:coiled-coil and C2 domain-containing protein 2A
MSPEVEDKAIEAAARYVSLIPFIDDVKLFKDMPSVACTAQEFIDLGMGGPEEHAMLLCNYFNYIDLKLKRQKTNPTDKGKDIRSYLVYGEAVPYGETWFVMRADYASNNDNVEIWDPNTGEVFSFDREIYTAQSAVAKNSAPGMNVRANDPICPLKKIWMIIDQENAWANIQEN